MSVFTIGVFVCVCVCVCELGSHLQHRSLIRPCSLEATAAASAFQSCCQPNFTKANESALISFSKGHLFD